jgi:hypothetical protein
MSRLRFPDYPSARVCPPLGWAEFDRRIFTDPEWYPRVGMNDSDIAKFTDVDWTKYVSFRVDGGNNLHILTNRGFFKLKWAREMLFCPCVSAY